MKYFKYWIVENLENKRKKNVFEFKVFDDI
jgi:hypothetical protein